MKTDFVTVTITENNEFKVCMDGEVFCILKYVNVLYNCLYKAITRSNRMVVPLRDDKQLEIQRSGCYYNFKFIDEDNRLVKISEYEFMEFCQGIIDASRFLGEDSVAVPYELSDAIDMVLSRYKKERR